MTRRTTRQNPQLLPKDLKANKQSEKIPSQAQESNSDIESSIIKNWNLSHPNINTCISPNHWPQHDSNPKKWPADIVRLLHEASEVAVQKNSTASNEHFRSSIAVEIQQRQCRNKSVQGRAPWMTVADIRAVVRKLKSGSGETKAQEGGEEKLGVRRGRSKGNTAARDKLEENGVDSMHQQHETDTVPHFKKREEKTNPATARKVPLRPRKTRNKGLPAPSRPHKNALPAPITPANPPALSEEDGEGDEENDPPSPVSGRHIYGALIKPTTLDFNLDDSTSTAQPQPRLRTRKRGRADDSQTNVSLPMEIQVHIDPDPRDIDATGFLSELDPKESRDGRGKMKVSMGMSRLQRLQREQVVEPAWAKNIDVPETTALTAFATERAVESVIGVAEEDAGMEMLKELLPCIPDNATVEERMMLEDRVALMSRDIVAYKMAVRGIEERVES